MAQSEPLTPPGPNCLEARDLWFAYEAQPPALRGISLSIAAGDFVAIIGQNGSGKSTLAKQFNGLLRPAQGQVLLFGRDIQDRSVGELAHTVGYVFQNPDHQIFSASTRDEIAFGPRNLGLAEEEVRQRTEEALRLFDLSAYADLQPSILGFGQRRKISLAAVYAMRPQVLILDEPTSGLDWRSIRELMRLVVRLREQGRTILLITHDMRLVAEYAPRCLVLKEGRLVAFDETRSIFAQTDLLVGTKIAPPQITELARRLAPRGLMSDILTVDEFCDRYGGLLEKTGGVNAGHG